MTWIRSTTRLVGSARNALVDDCSIAQPPLLSHASSQLRETPGCFSLAVVFSASFFTSTGEAAPCPGRDLGGKPCGAKISEGQGSARPDIGKARLRHDQTSAR